MRKREENRRKKPYPESATVSPRGGHPLRSLITPMPDSFSETKRESERKHTDKTGRLARTSRKRREIQVRERKRRRKETVGIFPAFQRFNQII